MSDTGSKNLNSKYAWRELTNKGLPKRSAPQRTADFLDVPNNPTITFHSTRLVKTGPDTFEVDGDFTIRGVTKPEKLEINQSLLIVSPSPV